MELDWGNRQRRSGRGPSAPAADLRVDWNSSLDGAWRMLRAAAPLVTTSFVVSNVWQNASLQATTLPCGSVTSMGEVW